MLVRQVCTEYNLHFPIKIIDIYKRNIYFAAEKGNVFIFLTALSLEVL
jgi:hypothetical protein